MTPSCCLVIQRGGAWAIRSRNRTLGPFSSRVRAIGAAIDFAGKDGKAGRPAKVLMQEDGKDRLDLRTRPLPQHARQPRKWPGPTGHIGCHDEPSRIPSESWVQRIR